MIDQLRQDGRFAFRTLGKNLGFTSVAVLTLGLGIGANTAVYSVVSAVLSVPFPIEDIDGVVVVSSGNQARNLNRSPVSADDFLDWRDQSQSFTQLVAATRLLENLRGSSGNVNFAGKGEPIRVQAYQTSAGFFSLVGHEPVLGRGFLPGDDEPGAAKVAVLSHGFWQSQLGGDAGILNEEILLDGEAYRVVGIAPEDFFFPSPNTALWTPLVLAPGSVARNERNLFVMGRLLPGVTIERARAEMQAIALRLEDAYPDTNQDWSARVESFRDNVLASSVRAMVLMYSAISLVLLIACSNVANLMLARAATREREMSLRTALGANRPRIFRQLLTESVSLALLGGALGLVIGYWGMSVLKAMYNVSPALVVVTNAMHLDLAVLGHTTLLSVLAGILFGVLPAFQGSRPDLQSALKEGGRQAGSAPGRLRLKDGLVVGQVALALTLLIVTTLLIRAQTDVWSIDPGFDPENLLTVPIELPEASYPSDEDVDQFYREALNRMADSPGIEAAAAATRLPLSRFAATATTRVRIEDRPELDEGEAPTIIDVVVSPGYFEALRVPILHGRGLTATDNDTSLPVAVVSEAFVKRYWPDAEPLGKRFKVGAATSDDPWVTVIGVSRDVLTNVPSLDSLDVALPHAFLPMAQHPHRSMTFLLRGQAGVAAVTGSARDIVRQIDPNQALGNVVTMDDRLEQQRVGNKTGMYILSALSAVALMLAGVGIYGVISYFVSQRRQEIGIRLALGDEPAHVLRSVLAQSLRLTGIGLTIGLVMAGGLTHLLKSQLPALSQTRGTDPLTYVGVSLLLLLVAMLASFLPARRAMRVDPIIALRYE